MSEEAKLYLRTLLEYAEGFDGFLEALDEAFKADPNDDAAYDAHNAKMGEVSSEVHSFLAAK